jgi:hypothetical protein
LARAWKRFPFADTMATSTLMDDQIVGFTVYYRSLDVVEDEKRSAIAAACEAFGRGRTWLSCEPVYFFGGDDDGHLLGGSKPNFMPHPDDVASAQAEDLPDGTIEDALDILCQLSREHGVDWEISHDYSEGPIGFIRNGEADAEVLQQIEAFGGLGDILSEFDMDDDGALPTDDDDEGPNILPFRPHGL